MEAYRRETEGKVASKDDLKVTTTTLRSEIADLRTELKTEMADLRTELKTEMANLGSEMHQGFKEQMRWLSGLIFVAAGVVVAAVKLLH